jgi:hypothetical protein
MTDDLEQPEILPEPQLGMPPVGMEIWTAFARTFSPEFADSWLYGAKLLPGGKLMPRTVTAWLKLRDVCGQHGKQEPSPGLRMMRDLGLELAEKPPLPFHLSGKKSAYEIFGLEKRK